jgi:response regulator RpfG family c-di-GMP phosphodiesterase
MSKKILFVDDEQNVLSGLERALRREFEVNTALSGSEGLAAIEARGPFALVVSDMRMPGMDGIEFLAKVKEISPDSVRIMLTGNADMQTAVDAVNEGNIFRFLNKPCAHDLMEKTLRAGLEQYRLVRAERELLEKTVSGCVQMLTEILAFSNQAAFSRAARVRNLAGQIARELGFQNGWQVEIAAMLCQIGCLTVPERLFKKLYNNEFLTAEETRLLESHPQAGHDLVAHIPRLEAVAEIISYQEKHYDGTGFPHNEVRGNGIPVGARILKVALDFDKLVEGEMSPTQAYLEIEKREGWYDPKVVEALKMDINRNVEYEKKQLDFQDLRPGMKLAEGIRNVYGMLLLESGYEITASFCLHLRSFVERGIVKGPFNMLIPVRREDTAERTSSRIELSV